MLAPVYMEGEAKPHICFILFIQIIHNYDPRYKMNSPWGIESLEEK